MSGRVVPLGTDIHNAVQALLPWYVSSRLDESELARVQAHLADCPRCRTELEWERKLQAAQLEPEPETGAADVEQGLAMLRSRIAMDRQQPRQVAFGRHLRHSWHDAAPWLRWVIAGQCAAVVTLSVLLLPIAPDERYRALGSADPLQSGAARGNLVIRFRPDTTEQELRRVLKLSGAQLVHGPTATDAYLLSVAAGHETAAVARLRKEAAVLLVESLDAGAER